MTSLQPSLSPILVATVAFGFVLVSCDGSDKHGELPPDEAADRIQTSMDDFGENLRTLEEGRFSSATKTFFGLDNGTASAADWASRLLSELEAVAVKTDPFFSLEAGTGEFAWDGPNQTWGTESAADDLILHFPLEEGAKNDATFTLRNYVQDDFSVEGELMVVPTEIDAFGSVNDAETFSVRLTNVQLETHDGLNTPVPESLSLTLFTAPYTHRLEVTKRSLASYDVTYDLRSDDEVVAAVSANVVLTLTGDEPIGMGWVEELVGQARLGAHLVVPFSLEPRPIAETDDPSEDMINDHLDASVRYQDRDAASLRYDKPTDGIEIVYSDGSTDSVSQLLADFIQEMEDVWRAYPTPTSLTSAAKPGTAP